MDVGAVGALGLVVVEDGHLFLVVRVRRPALDPALALVLHHVVCVALALWFLVPGRHPAEPIIALFVLVVGADELQVVLAVESLVADEHAVSTVRLDGADHVRGCALGVVRRVGVPGADLVPGLVLPALDSRSVVEPGLVDARGHSLEPAVVRAARRTAGDVQHVRAELGPGLVGRGAAFDALGAVRADVSDAWRRDFRMLFSGE